MDARSLYQQTAAWLRESRPFPANDPGRTRARRPDASSQSVETNIGAGDDQRRRRQSAAGADPRRAPLPVFPGVPSSVPATITGGGTPPLAGGFEADAAAAVIAGAHPDGVRINSMRPAFFDDYFGNQDLSTEWTQERGVWTLGTNKITPATAGTDTPRVALFYNRQTYKNGAASVVCGGTTTGTTHFVGIRMTNAAGKFYGYLFKVDLSNSRLYSCSNNVLTQIGAGLGSLAAGDTIEIRAVGTNITGLINGITVIDIFNATHAAGYAGIGTTMGVATAWFSTFHSYTL